MNRFEKTRRNALTNAKVWAKNGNAFMANAFIRQVDAVRPLTDRELGFLNRCLAEAQEGGCGGKES